MKSPPRNIYKPKAISPAPEAETKPVSNCPYCRGKDIIKSGRRKKKLETVQVYLCRHCQKKFTPLITKSKTYPVAVILKSLILYNRFLTPQQAAARIRKDYGLNVSPRTISNWISQYRDFQPFHRMRGPLQRKIKAGEARPTGIFAESRLFHNQIYDFKYHRAKAGALIRGDHKNLRLQPIKTYLENTMVECPHEIFRSSQNRSSQFKNLFSLDKVRITNKHNRATEMARFVIQAVAKNKERHQRLQEFMFFCDSTTIAVEVPIILGKSDISHFKTRLNFKVPVELKKDETITGHVDFVQMRNGLVHILDYKPNAQKEKPVAQLTFYALALSRLTGLRLFDFKCAWFDENDYFEFYPLHVVYKEKKSEIHRQTFRT